MKRAGLKSDESENDSIGKWFFNRNFIIAFSSLTLRTKKKTQKKALGEIKNRSILSIV